MFQIMSVPPGLSELRFESNGWMNSRYICEVIVKMLIMVIVIVILAFSYPVRAEGGCPPGHYPIGGQGVQGCAPIPQGGGGAGSPSPIGRWIKTWGAIATSSTGAFGVSTRKVKKRDAVRVALSECASGGATDCRLSFSYKNQCAAAATPDAGSRGTYFSSGASETAAEGAAVKLCESHGGVGCGIAYSACTDPEFKYYSD